MKNYKVFSKGVFIISASLFALTVSAKDIVNGFKINRNSVKKVLAGCSAPQSAQELSINNVRTIIYSGSDMWWDLFGTTNAYYVVPKVENKSDYIHSNFAGNIWIGGIDESNNLKIAAQTYRQDGIDFWTGPLNTSDASVDGATCTKYDKIFKMYRSEVDNYVKSDFDASFLTQNIKDWPGTGDISLGHDPLLAPWADKNNVEGGDGVYEPAAGDYPYYDVYGSLGKDALGQCKAKVYGDETLWWVYNDNGNVHQATGGTPIGMEVRAQAFAFKTTDEVNNMTFYNYQIINRSTTKLNQTFMTVWTDADLGCYNDDYIGCDVKRGLGYIYNGDASDATCASPGYGDFIPALGCDFFQGPIPEANGIDDDNDNGMDPIKAGEPTGIDEAGEQMGMTKFMYYNNVQTGPKKNPDNALEYYNFMRGIWADGSPLTYGGDGYGGAQSTDFAYPGDTHPTNPLWDESAAPDDRRFLQSAGPFTLLPGAVNYVTIGLPWARTTQANNPKASIPLLKIADDKAQALFDNCFQLISGPEAPDITIQELPNELILYFSNKPTSNNYLFGYEEKDPNIVYDTTHYTAGNDKYVFEGFVVYQLKNESIGISELKDGSKAKIVFQSDLNNGIKRLVNYELDQNVGADAPVVKVDGIDNGIKTTFRFTKDMFSKTSDQKVVNSKEYYFLAVAYGYNEFGKYKADKSWSVKNGESFEGQKFPYLQGRLTKKGLGIPHDPKATAEEYLANSIYGFGPKITRIEGQGNGGNSLELTQGSVDAIVANGNRVNHITYENGRGPIGIKIVDPLNVPNSTFSVRMLKKKNIGINEKDSACDYNYYTNPALPHLKANSPNIINTLYGSVVADSITWVLTDLGTNKEYVPCKSIKIGEEFYFSDLGISVNIAQVNDLGHLSSPSVDTDKLVKEGDLIDASMDFSNPSSVWLTGVSDADITDGFHGKNWIRSGGFSTPAADNISNRNDYRIGNTDESGYLDQTQVFEKVLGGTWAPYCLTASTKVAGVFTSPALLGGQVFAAPAWEFLTPNSSSKAYINPSPYYDIRALGSVQIVLTKDKSKWTRSMVLEECDNASTNPTGARKLEPRRALSVDKQGKSFGMPGYVASEAEIDSVPGTPFKTGLSWFPGYAVNLETGERLNIAFGEDSYQGAWNPDAAYRNNGEDMMWNPTHSETKLNVNGNPVDDDSKGYPYLFGGRHYIYVFGNNRSATNYGAYATAATSYASNKMVGVGTYQNFAEFAYLYKNAFHNFKSSPNILTNGVTVGARNALHNIWSEAMWVNIPLLKDKKFSFSNPENMPCDVTVKLKVKKSYKYGYAGNYQTTPKVLGTLSAIPPYELMAANHPTVSGVYTYTNNLTAYIANSTDAINNNFGYYTFNTSDVYSLARSSDDSKSALDLINVVPNPYYGYSKYEKNRTENTIRFTNLPNTCKIKIYTLNGTLIRTFDRDVTEQYDDFGTTNKSDFNQSKRKPYFDWDLKNQSGIAIASGLYIIHFDVPGVGEKILKWFGVMRPVDLQNY